MNVIRTIYLDPRLVPGGGATEMTLANKLVEQSKVQEPEIANAYRAAGKVRAPSRSTATRRTPTVSPQAQPLSPVMRSSWIVHVSQALEVIPRTLLENCGADIIRVLTQLRAKHAGGANTTWGIDGDKGCLADMNDVGVWEPVSVKAQVITRALCAVAAAPLLVSLSRCCRRADDQDGDRVGGDAPPYRRDCIWNAQEGEEEGARPAAAGAARRRGRRLSPPRQSRARAGRLAPLCRPGRAERPRAPSRAMRDADGPRARPYRVPDYSSGRGLLRAALVSSQSQTARACAPRQVYKCCRRRLKDEGARTAP